MKKLKEKYNIIIPFLYCSCFEILRSGKPKNLESTGLKHCLASLLIFFLTFTVIPELGFILFDFEAFIALSLGV
ncbi:MAG: hypothetical protein ACXACX_21805 [Candidatus Hodarchaeales archaeon]